MSNVKCFPVNLGLSLLETVIYVAFLGVIAVFVSNFLITIVDTYNTARSEREVLSNARLLLETVVKVAGESREIYTPTSRFNNDAGQLSLISATTTYPEHTTFYTDFYVDNGQLWVRREGEAAHPLSAPTVRINAFRLERVVQSFNREAVRITFRVEASSLRHPASTTLYSSVVLRGNY